jgi:hypothetical protein
MRRVLSFLATGVLAAGMAMAQTSSAPSAPPPQDTNSAGSSADGRTGSTASANSPDTTAGADQNADATRSSNAQDNMDRATKNPNGDVGANGTSDSSTAAATGGRSDANANGDAARAESADASNQDTANTQRADAPRGGIPWMWIALGIVALIVIFSLFGGNRDRVDRTGRVEVIDRNRYRTTDERLRDDVRGDRDDDIRRVG